MKNLFSLAILFTFCLPALAGNWNSFSWSQLKREEKLKAGFVMAPDDTTPFEQLRLTARSGPVVLLTIENPEITETGFGISGQVKYQDLTQNGNLEMVAFFPGGKTFCVKAIGPNYFALTLRGSADWTHFFIGFYLSSDGQKPDKIQVRINLPGQGTAFLSPLNFGQFNKRTPVQVTSSDLSNVFFVFLGLVTALGLTFRWTLSKYKPGKWVLAFIIPMMIMGSLLFLFGTLTLIGTGQFITFAPFLFLGAGEILLPWVLKARAQIPYQ